MSDDQETRQINAALLKALNDLWVWASEQRTHLTTDPVPDGLGAEVLEAIARAEGRS